jgi:hypothetical protein
VARIVVTIALFGTFDSPSARWLLGGGVAAGLLWTSPEDLFVGAAQRREAEA